MNQIKSRFFVYLLCYLVVVYSSLEYFRQPGMFVALVLLSFFLFKFYSLKFDYKILYIALYIVFIVFLQSIFWGGKVFTTINLLLIMVFVPYFLLKIIGIEFPRFVVDIIYVYAIISLVFWLATVISPEFHKYIKGLAEILGTHPINQHDPFAGNPEEFIIYTYEANTTFGIVRNPGPFHEPGAFSVFLIFGIIFNSIATHRITDKKNIVMIVALITTFSTAGILALMVLVLFYIQTSGRIPIVVKGLLLVLILPSLIYLFFSLDILSPKINSQMEGAKVAGLYAPTSGRLLGAMKAIYVLEKYPIRGRGMLSMTKAELNSPEASGYGFMDFAARLGIIGAIFYLGFLYKSLYRYCQFYKFNPMFAFFAFIALLLVLFSQAFSDTILFMMLFLASFIFEGQFKHPEVLEETADHKQLLVTPNGK